ncbi:MAG: glycosyltransferase family 39 protein [Cyclobacteriaceae bacterium]
MKVLLGYIIKRRSLFESIGIFLTLFIFSRYCIYKYFNIPYLLDDAPTYVMVVDYFLGNSTLSSSARPPGYPILLLFSYLISSDVRTVMLVQSTLSIAAGILFITTIYKTYRRLVKFAAIAVLIYMTDLVYVHHETAILSETLFSNLLIVYSAFLLLAIKRDKLVFWCGSGASVAILVMVKPIGAVLYVHALIVFIFLIYTKKFSKKTVAFALSLSILFLSHLIYNRVTAGEASVKEYQTKKFLTFVHPVFAFIEKQDEYPDKINDLVEKYRDKTPPGVRTALQTSWNPRIVSWAALSNEHNYEDFIKDYDKLNGSFPLLNIVLPTLKAQPEVYLRWVYSMFIHYFDILSPSQRRTYKFLNEYETSFPPRVVDYLTREMNKDGAFYTFNSPRITNDDVQSNIQNAFGDWMYTMTQSFYKSRQAIFQNVLWVIVYVVALVFSVVMFVNHGFQDRDNFAFLLILTLPMLFSLAYSMVHTTNIRYAYPLTFVYYLAPIFLYLIYTKRKNGRSNEVIKID